MKSPKEYLKEANIGDCVIFERNKISVWLVGFILEVQKDAYNQAIEDAADNAIADYNIIGDSDFAEDNDIECYVIKNSILKLKIK